jgi:hypothetical protein
MYLSLLFASTALAGWPEDVNLAGMTEQDGVLQVDTETLSEDYRQLIRELGVAVGQRGVLPAHTLGARGFEVTADTNLNFRIPWDQPDDYSPWQRAHTNEDPGEFLFQPGISVRKGLPFSLEVGLGGRWIGQSRQGVITGFARAAVVEGYKPYPDINVHVGGSGYVGNSQLELGVFDAGVTIGTRAPLGPPKGARAAALAPFVDVTVLVITSAPKIDTSTRAQIGATAFGNRDVDEDPLNNAKALAVPTFNGGLQLDAGNVALRFSGGWALNAAPWAAASVGFTY